MKLRSRQGVVLTNFGEGLRIHVRFCVCVFADAAAVGERVGEPQETRTEHDGTETETGRRAGAPPARPGQRARRLGEDRRPGEAAARGQRQAQAGGRQPQQDEKVQRRTGRRRRRPRARPAGAVPNTFSRHFTAFFYWYRVTVGFLKRSGNLTTVLGFNLFRNFTSSARFYRVFFELCH